MQVANHLVPGNGEIFKDATSFINDALILTLLAVPEFDFDAIVKFAGNFQNGFEGFVVNPFAVPFSWTLSDGGNSRDDSGSTVDFTRLDA